MCILYVYTCIYFPSVDRQKCLFFSDSRGTYSAIYYTTLYDTGDRRRTLPLVLDNRGSRDRILSLINQSVVACSRYRRVGGTNICSSAIPNRFFVLSMSIIPMRVHAVVRVHVYGQSAPKRCICIRGINNEPPSRSTSLRIASFFKTDIWFLNGIQIKYQTNNDEKRTTARVGVNV